MSQSQTNQQPKQSQAIASTQDMSYLLQFQEKLLHLVHSELYSQQNVDQDAIMKFQINYITEVNESWKKMVEDLLFRLVRQKNPYESTLRDHFHKVLNVDFLPFLRINKHELSQVSLYGFDIYVQPLSAILEIINRLEGQRHILHKHNKENKQQQTWHTKHRDAWDSLQKGWDHFLYEAALHKISLNLYLLRDYLKVAAKSLVKKDKQIVFTGCCNFFNEVVPTLKERRQIWLLCEIAELNNELYQFHPSFNYSHFFSLMLPIVNQYEPIFRSMAVVGQKCLNACILTPLLFAVLRHRESFHQFIEQVDDPCWIPYLNGIVFALIYNFKARILEYEQAMQILIGAILKLGIFQALDISYFIGQLGKQWNQVRDFFISALKIGYNVGQLQTWHPTDYQAIQQRIINCTKDSLLMHSELPKNVPAKIYFQKGFQVELQQCLREISGSLLNREQLFNSFSPNISQVIQIKDSLTYCILRLAHLLKACKLTNNLNCLCYIISFLNKVQNVNSKILAKRLGQIGDTFCETAIQQIQKQQKGRQDLKQVLFTYIKKHKPITKLKQVIKVCLMISTPKQAMSQILSIIESQAAELKQIQNLHQLVAANIIAMFCPQRLQGSVKVKTFQKQYTIEPEIINLNSKLHSCINVLVEKIIQTNSTHATQILMWVVRLCNWIIIPLLSFPVSSQYDRNEPNKKLQSFGLWFIKNPELYPLLIEMISIGMNLSNQQIKTYFVQISIITICDQIIMEINRVLNQLAEVEDNLQYRYIIRLLQVFFQIYSSSSSKSPQNAPNSQILKKIMKLYLRCLQKLNIVLTNNEDEQIALQIIASFYQLYCPLIDLLFENTQNARKWRKNMRKICLTTLDINKEQINNIRDFQIPSLRKDKGFLIHNPVEYSKQQSKQSSSSSLKFKSRVETLINQSKKIKQPKAFNQKQQIYTRPEYFLATQQIRDFVLSQKQAGMLNSKEYLLPALSLNTISLLFKNCSQNSVLIISDLLATTTANHRKLIQWSLANKNKQILIRIGLSKQAVETQLPEILGLLNGEQLGQLVSILNYASKRSISDNFNLILMKQQIQGTPEQNRQKQLIKDLSGDLSFLLVLNQSNWRYANELINSKQIGLSNIPSVLLQYLEYIRITSNTNQDYEQRISSYLEMIEAYKNLLSQKHEFIMSIENQTSKQDMISEEQIKLFKINELAYISSFCQAWSIKDFLHRAANLLKQIKLINKQREMFNNVTNLIYKVADSFVQITIIVNQIAIGNIICPDFLSSYSICSQNAYQTHKILIGQNIQDFYRKTDVNHQQIYTYQPLGKNLPVNQYINEKIKDVTNPVQINNMRVEIMNKNDYAIKKQIAEKYQSIQKYLILHKMISTQNQTLQFLWQNENGQTDQNEKNKIKLIIFNFGLLFHAMEITGQNKLKLEGIVDQCRNRHMLTWQLVKNFDSQAYHHIKAILIDEQIQSRKINFIYKQKLLLPQGANIEVGKYNRQKYCNLVAKMVIGESCFETLTLFTQGYHCLV